MGQFVCFQHLRQRLSARRFLAPVLQPLQLAASLRACADYCASDLLRCWLLAAEVSSSAMVMGVNCVLVAVYS
jgi:hypothetical protein